jgi:hypothetical protein
MQIGDFRGQAEKENQGWLNTARTAADKTVGDYERQRTQVDPYYSTLFDELAGQKVQSGKALTASMIRRGVGRSGIMTNAESNLEQTYGKLNQRMGEEKRQKIGEIDAGLGTARQQRANVDVEYQSKVDQLARELYNAWKTEEDQRLYNQQQLALARAGGSGSGWSPSNNNQAAVQEMTPYERAQQLIKQGATWGSAANAVENEYQFKIAPGSQIDQLFWQHYKGTGPMNALPAAKKTTTKKFNWSPAGSRLAGQK